MRRLLCRICIHCILACQEQRASGGIPSWFVACTPHLFPPPCRIPYRTLMDFSGVLPVGVSLDSAAESPFCQDIVTDATCVPFEDICYFVQGRELEALSGIHPFQMEEYRATIGTAFQEVCQPNLGIACNAVLPAGAALAAENAENVVPFNCSLVTSWYSEVLGTTLPAALDMGTLLECDPSQVGGGSNCFALSDVCRFTQGTPADYMRPESLNDQSFYNAGDPGTLDEQFAAWLGGQVNQMCQFAIGQPCAGELGLFRRQMSLTLSDVGLDEPLYSIDCSKIRLYSEVVSVRFR